MKTLAYDDNELSGSEERDGAGTQEDLAKLRATIKALARKSGKDDGEYQKMLDRVLGRHGQSDGAAATDRQRRARDAGPLDGHGVPGDTDEVDEDAVTERVYEILRGQGWTDEKIESELAKRREEGAEDVIPHSAIGGRLHARTGSGTIRPHDADEGVAYPGIENILDLPSYQPDPSRFSSTYNPATGRDPRDRIRDRGERLGAQLRSGGVSRRLSNDAAPRLTEAELMELYGDGFGVTKVGAF